MSERGRRATKIFLVVVAIGLFVNFLVCHPLDGGPSISRVIELPGPNGILLGCWLEGSIAAVLAGLVAIAHLFHPKR
jgi:hypothetical protein